jgi:competence protein ComEA
MPNMTRIWIVVGVVALAAFCLWHPVPGPLSVSAAPSPHGDVRGSDRAGRKRDSNTPAADPVVYVAGAVKRPGLYRLHATDRAGDAVRMAGGDVQDADPWAVNLAAHLRDGDEVYVPKLGERAVPAASKRSRRSRASPEPAGDVDVNRADAETLGRVPGIGRAIAARVVELRERDGPYASLDELLDAAGMTQARLERARPFLRPP